VQQKSCSFGAVPQSFAACSCSNCAVAFLSDYMIKMHFNTTARQKNAAATEFKFCGRKILLDLSGRLHLRFGCAFHCRMRFEYHFRVFDTSNDYKKASSLLCCLRSPEPKTLVPD
jgi:hypothetical protein